MKTSAFNRIYAEAQRVNIQSSEWFNFAGFFLDAVLRAPAAKDAGVTPGAGL